MHFSQNLQLSQSQRTVESNSILKNYALLKGNCPYNMATGVPSRKVERQTFEKQSGVKFSQDNNVAPT